MSDKFQARQGMEALCLADLSKLEVGKISDWKDKSDTDRLRKHIGKDPKIMEKIMSSHQSDCCQIHGCSFGEDEEDCPITNGTSFQLYECPECADMPEEIRYRSCPSHCCILHGCKYGMEGCPVVTEKIVQEYTCEDCSYEKIKSVAELQKKMQRKPGSALDKLITTFDIVGVEYMEEHVNGYTNVWLGRYKNILFEFDSNGRLASAP